MATDNLLPELWAREMVAVIDSDSVIAIMPRDNDGLFQRYRDRVRVGEFLQEVVLDKVYHDTFFVPDKELHRSFADMVEVYMAPAARSLASLIREDFLSVQGEAPAGVNAVIVCRPQANDIDGNDLASLGSRRFQVTYNGLSLSVSMRYSSNGYQDQEESGVIVKVEMLAGIAAIQSTAPIVLVPVAQTRKAIIEEIEAERAYQDKRWGTAFDDKNTANDWSKYICDYASAASPLKLDQAVFEEKMTKVAALAIAAVEASRRNGGPAKRHYD